MGDKLPWLAKIVVVHKDDCIAQPDQQFGHGKSTECIHRRLSDTINFQDLQTVLSLADSVGPRSFKIWMNMSKGIRSNAPVDDWECIVIACCCRSNDNSELELEFELESEFEIEIELERLETDSHTFLSIVAISSEQLE
ncbi:hypothetical protein U1Q18_043248 [Sarracenia purpurea var. burkii]